MAKRRRTVSKQGHEFNASEELDDHLLPSPAELIEYQKVDPGLIAFLQDRAAKEQDNRWDIQKSIFSLNKREQILTHGINYFALIVGAIVLLYAMYSSYNLIMNDKVITGSVFGGIVLLWVIYMLVSVSKRGEIKPPANP